MRDTVLQAMRDASRLINEMTASTELIEQVVTVAQSISSALQQGKRIYLFGNGGSAADAQHIAAEFVGRFKKERAAWPAEALTVNTSILTALANDYDYSIVFARQIEGYGLPGDICIGLSTSGNARNVLLGLEAAAKKGMKTVGMTGVTGGAIKDKAEVCLCMPTADTPRIQEMTILVAHIICDLVEQTIVTASDQQHKVE